jgi:response regulator of citrate/malate metabolism
MTTRDIGVLVVDDDFKVAALHADFVSRVHGFTVVGNAHTAHAALEIARTRSPDLVLLDLYLPDEHGLALLPRLRSGAGPHPDVIAITAARDMPSVRTAMQGGVVHYLVKPFPFRLLAQRLTAYRDIWLRTTAGGTLDQRDVDQIFGLSAAETATTLPKGCSLPTLALVRAAFDAADGDLSASEVGERVGISRATAQRYLAHLQHEGTLVLQLRYGTAGRPEHRFRRTRT